MSKKYALLIAIIIGILAVSFFYNSDADSPIIELPTTKPSPEQTIIDNSNTDNSSINGSSTNGKSTNKPSTNDKSTDESSIDKSDTYVTSVDEPAIAEPPIAQDEADYLSDEGSISTKVTLSVTCQTILDNLDKFDSSKLSVLPKDGVIYQKQEVDFNEGETVFDVLLREMKNNKIHMEFVKTPIYNSNYIEGINNIYEFDCGPLSGWHYRVNGEFASYGSSQYFLKNGDVIEWLYSCDLGRDIGDVVGK